ncbi:MAG: transporter ATP-binding protein [Microbacteriaceae bacterium]|nr:transporter ATP-binding protein [Microbacteriaceae bacterium]
MSTGAPLLEVEGLVRWFEGVKAVDGVSFTLQAGQVVGLIGANGAGKTTTMRLLATLDIPDRGTVRLGGVDIVERPNEVRQRIGWMPDHFAAYKDTTVADYLDFFGRAHGLRGSDLINRVTEVTEFTDLTELSTREMAKLSKGQTQRLCLARTLLNDPEFLLLDEPAAGLDPKARLEFKNLVRVLRERGKTILISSHILSELGEMCDTLIFMDRGAVMHHGDTDSIRRGGATTGACLIDITVDGPVAPLLQWLAMRPGWKVAEERRDGVRAAFLNAEPAALAAELRRLVLDNVAVMNFHREHRRLEEAFVDMLRDPQAPRPLRIAVEPPILPPLLPPTEERLP